MEAQTQRFSIERLKSTTARFRLSQNCEGQPIPAATNLGALTHWSALSIFMNRTVAVSSSYTDEYKDVATCYLVLLVCLNAKHSAIGGAFPVPDARRPTHSLLSERVYAAQTCIAYLNPAPRICRTFSTLSVSALF